MMKTENTSNPIIGTGFKTLSKIRDGNSSVVLSLSNDSHVIPCDEDGNNGNYSECYTDVSLYEGNELMTSVNYVIETSSGVEGEWNPALKRYSVTNISSNMVYGYVDFKVNYKGAEYNSRFTLSKTFNGKDAYSVDISNEVHVFSSDSTGTLDSDITTKSTVYAYKGTEMITTGFRIELPKEEIPGLRLSLTGQEITIVALKGRLLSNQGEFEIKVYIEGKIFRKTFSWSKTKSGESGYTIVSLPQTISIVFSEYGTILGKREFELAFDIISNTDGQSVDFSIESYTCPNGFMIDRDDINNKLVLRVVNEDVIGESGIVEVGLLRGTTNYYQTITYGVTRNGESPYTISMYSSNGMVFKDGVVNTILEAVVRRGIKIVNDEVGQNAFEWTKKDKEGNVVIEWIPNYYRNRKDMIEITSEDIIERATFECSINI